MKKTFPWIRVIILMLVLFGVIVWAVMMGSSNMTLSDSLKTICAKLPIIKEKIDLSEISTTYEVIIWKVRMPRVLLSALVGGALAIVGAAFQGVFRNSLADPHILGVSSGAALGATVAMLTGISVNFMGLGAIGVLAFLGALVTVFFVYQIARVGGELSTINMLLTGTAMSTMLSAIISLLMIFNKEQIDKVYMWTMGSFSAANWDKVKFLAVFTIVGFIFLISFSSRLNILMLGEDDARCIGVDTVKTRRVIIVVASLLVAAAVSVSGVIGFVGLIIPHSIRIVCGADNKKLLPYAFFVGAIFLTVCDTLARTISAPTEIPVGIITSVCGAPYFIGLIISRRKRV